MSVRRMAILALFSVLVSGCANATSPVSPLAPNRLASGTRELGASKLRHYDIVDGFESVPLPVQTNTNSALLLTGGADGNVWFTDPGDNLVGYINPNSRTYGTFVVPTNSEAGGVSPQALRQAPNGPVYFMTDCAFGTATTSGIALYQTCSSGETTGLYQDNDIAPVSGGGLYYSGSDGKTLRQLFYASPMATPAAPIPLPRKGSEVGGPTLGSDGNIYFLDYKYNTVGRYNVTTNEYDTDTLKVPGGNLGGGSAYPSPDGNLWVCGANNVTLADWSELSLSTLTFTHVASESTLNCPQGVDQSTIGSDGAFWYAGSPSLGRIDGTSHQFSTYNYQVIPFNQGAEAIASGSDGNIWFYSETNTLGVFHMQTASSTPTAIKLAADAKKNVSLAEKNYSGAFTFNSGASTCSGLGVTVKAISASKVSVTNGTATSGSCAAVFTDANGMASVYVTITLI